MDYSYAKSILTIMPAEEIDHSSVLSLRPFTDDLIVKYSPEILKIDMSNVDFMDSAGIGYMIGRYKIMKKNKGKVIVAGAKSKITRILKLASLETIIEIE